MSQLWPNSPKKDCLHDTSIMYGMKLEKKFLFKVQIQKTLMLSLISKTFTIEMEFKVEMPN